MRRRWLPWAFLVGLLVVSGTGCGLITATQETQGRLEDAGFEADLSVDETNGFTTATVDVLQAPGREDDATRAACVVWETFPYEIDEVAVIDRGGNSSFDRSELGDSCGTRPASFDEESVGGALVRTGIGVAVVLGVLCLALVVGIVVLIVFLVRRSTRKRAEAQAAGYQYGPSGAYGPYGYQQPPYPYGAPGYGPPPAGAPGSAPSWGAPPRAGAEPPEVDSGEPDEGR